MDEPSRARARAFDAYARSIDTLPAAERVVMAYEGAIRFVEDAAGAIGRGEIEARFRASERARAIVRTLEGALDHERGGAIAANLGRLYGYIDRRLTDLNLANDPAIAEEIAGLLRALRDGWAQLARAGGGSRPAAAASGETAPARATLALSA